MKQTAERVFVHHDGALGDVLLSLPCIAKIRADASFLHLAGRPDISEFFCDTGMADEGSSSPGGIYSSLYTRSVDGELRRFLAEFDRAYIFSLREESELIRNIAAAVGDARTIVTLPRNGEHISVAVFRSRQLKAAGGDVKAFPLLRVSEDARIGALKLLEALGYISGFMDLIAVHPGSGGKAKCWPLQRYCDLMEMLLQSERSFIVASSGPAEDSETRTVLEGLASRYKRFMHLDNATLMTVASVVGMACLYIGNDSGITHLAAALGTPVVALFGPTDPVLWAPQGRSVQVIRAEDMSLISTEEVCGKVYDALAPAKPGGGGEDIYGAK